MNGADYTYAYDNIGNREYTQESAEEVTQYESNSLNQYTIVGDFTPQFDLEGNQTLVKTSTGIWRVTYNAENRPTIFTSEDSSIVVECAYDYMGRRATKKVTTNDNVTLHQRYIYRGYLQIACCDLLRSWQPVLWFILWDPKQPTATRPLAIQKDGVWYAYGWDLTKNITEVYGQTGYILTIYTYSPFGAVISDGEITQPVQWSSEFYDAEIGLVFYNYRCYNSTIGRWISRDMMLNNNFYQYVDPIFQIDFMGLDSRDISDVWNEYDRENPDRDKSLDDVRKNILAHGCIGYTCLHTGKVPCDIINLTTTCFYSFTEAKEERDKWITEKKCCDKKTDNKKTSEPKIFSVHSHLTQSELNGYNDAINTASFLRRADDARNKKMREHNLKELGNFDFGYVEKGDETITSGNHYHQKNDRAVYMTRSIEEWQKDVRKSPNDPITLYESELWCVVCNNIEVLLMHQNADVFIDF